MTIWKLDVRHQFNDENVQMLPKTINFNYNSRLEMFTLVEQSLQWGRLMTEVSMLLSIQTIQPNRCDPNYVITRQQTQDTRY